MRDGKNMSMKSPTAISRMQGGVMSQRTSLLCDQACEDRECVSGFTCCGGGRREVRWSEEAKATSYGEYWLQDIVI